MSEIKTLAMVAVEMAQSTSAFFQESIRCGMGPKETILLTTTFLVELIRISGGK